MRIALAYLTRGDKYDNWFVDNTFPIHAFDGVLSKTADSGNFAAARNELIAEAEKQEYDWIFFLDTDEAMFASDIQRIKRCINNELDDMIVLPRINILKNGLFEMTTYPDLQGRIFKLAQGYHFSGQPHETLFKGTEPINWYTKRSGLYLITCPIYHYGWCKPEEELSKRWWRDGEQTDVHQFALPHPLEGMKLWDFQ